MNIVTKTEKTVNYTPKMEAVLTAASGVSPIDYDRAKELGIELKRNPRSIIAKVKRMGLRYKAKEAPAKKAKPTTKAQYVVIIETALDSKLLGLEKAPVLALQNIIAAVSKIVKPENFESESFTDVELSGGHVCGEGFEPGDTLDEPVSEDATDGESLVTE